MSDMLGEAATWLADELKENASVAIFYFRSPFSVPLTPCGVSITATRAKTSYDVVDTQGYMTRVEMDDFIITAADLVGVPFVGCPNPQDGDGICLTNAAGKYEYYRVKQPGPNINAFQKCDPGGVLLRVHTKLTEVSSISP